MRLSEITVRQATEADAIKLFDLIAALAEHHNQLASVRTSSEKFQHDGFGHDPKFEAVVASRSIKVNWSDTRRE